MPPRQWANRPGISRVDKVSALSVALPLITDVFPQILYGAIQILLPGGAVLGCCKMTISIIDLRKNFSGLDARRIDSQDFDG
jgi:hypothetical protein